MQAQNTSHRRCPAPSARSIEQPPCQRSATERGVHVVEGGRGAAAVDYALTHIYTRASTHMYVHTHTRRRWVLRDRCG